LVLDARETRDAFERAVAFRKDHEDGAFFPLEDILGWPTLRPQDVDIFHNFSRRRLTLYKLSGRRCEKAVILIFTHSNIITTHPKKYLGCIMADALIK